MLLQHEQQQQQQEVQQQQRQPQQQQQRGVSLRLSAFFDAGRPAMTGSTGIATASRLRRHSAPDMSMQQIWAISQGLLLLL